MIRPRMDWNDQGHRASLAILALLAFGFIALSIARGVLLHLPKNVALDANGGHIVSSSP